MSESNTQPFDGQADTPPELLPLSVILWRDIHVELLPEQCFPQDCTFAFLVVIFILIRQVCETLVLTFDTFCW